MSNQRTSSQKSKAKATSKSDTRSQGRSNELESNFSALPVAGVSGDGSSSVVALGEKAKVKMKKKLRQDAAIGVGSSKGNLLR